ncbi:hypothetical protein PUN28_012015 [Cardiocondyla obscurior]|uniref:Uncharacterized protein n=1 Tax=Cardiocondyla obscurior TaxID=286306 RepID=A0AAW2FD83_9HYME
MGRSRRSLRNTGAFFAGFLRLNLHETFRLKWTSRLREGKKKKFRMVNRIYPRLSARSENQSPTKRSAAFKSTSSREREGDAGHGGGPSDLRDLREWERKIEVNASWTRERKRARERQKRRAKDEGQGNNESRTAVHTKDLEDVENSAGRRQAERKRKRGRGERRNASFSRGSNKKKKKGEREKDRDQRSLSRTTESVARGVEGGFRNEVQRRAHKTGAR